MNTNNPNIVECKTKRKVMVIVPISLLFSLSILTAFAFGHYNKVENNCQDVLDNTNLIKHLENVSKR